LGRHLTTEHREATDQRRHLAHRPARWSPRNRPSQVRVNRWREKWRRRRRDSTPTVCSDAAFVLSGRSDGGSWEAWPGPCDKRSRSKW